jgi:ABC-type glutathione transport system ATPase component
MDAMPPSIPLQTNSVNEGVALFAPHDLRRRANRLIDRRSDRLGEATNLSKLIAERDKYLAIGDKVSVALERLSQQLFKEVLGVVEDKLTIALQEILEQPIRLRAEADFKRGVATVDFWIEREGHREDVLRGQGGSVANILSVGLRLFALATLDEQKHRRVLVLDEQDCWLRPDLVPRLVKMIHEAGKALGFQIILISHHDVALFEQYADRIYHVNQNADGYIVVHPYSMSAENRDAYES